MSDHRAMPVAHRFRRALVAVCAASSLLLVSVLSAPKAAADGPDTPKRGAFTLTGAGYGHGWGMSQYGAYGAATKGLTWRQILSFYYPGTSLGAMTSGTNIRVWVTADRDRDLRVSPASGLKVTDSSGRSYTLPTGDRYDLWRGVRWRGQTLLQYRTPAGKWTNISNPLGQSNWTFSNSVKIIKVVLPDGSEREFRGKVSVIIEGDNTRTVNRLWLDTYLRSVVPAEMPTSWAADAVRSQAVAARSFAARTRADHGSSASWDVCDTQACQVYKGYATTSGGTRTLHETSGGNAAIAATAWRILRYGSTIAFTQFSSSNGGHSAQGDFPYLRAKPDPYDGVVKSQAWTRKITTAQIAAEWPAAGAVRQLHITGRDHDGPFGGRVTTILIIGSTSTVTVSGNAFRSSLGLRSTLFTIPA